MKIIKEEMKYRKKICEYVKNGVTKMVRKCYINRNFMYKELEKYKINIKSLVLKFRKSHHKTCIEEELNLIKKVKAKYYWKKSMYN